MILNSESLLRKVRSREPLARLPARVFRSQFMPIFESTFVNSSCSASAGASIRYA
jgi:hypothetical protein